jgi:hypothetical protein
VQQGKAVVGAVEGMGDQARTVDQFLPEGKKLNNKNSTRLTTYSPEDCNQVRAF